MLFLGAMHHRPALVPSRKSSSVRAWGLAYAPHAPLSTLLLLLLFSLLPLCCCRSASTPSRRRSTEPQIHTKAQHICCCCCCCSLCCRYAAVGPPQCQAGEEVPSAAGAWCSYQWPQQHAGLHTSAGMRRCSPSKSVQPCSVSYLFSAGCDQVSAAHWPLHQCRCGGARLLRVCIPAAVP
jgi:hypothetical protein